MIGFTHPLFHACSTVTWAIYSYQGEYNLLVFGSVTADMWPLFSPWDWKRRCRCFKWTKSDDIEWMSNLLKAVEFFNWNLLHNHKMLFIMTSNYKLLGHSNIATLITGRTIFILTEPINYTAYLFSYLPVMNILFLLSSMQNIKE